MSPPSQKEPASRPTWKASLTAYRHNRLRAVCFRTDEDRDRVIRLLHDDNHPLADAPFDIVDAKTILLPLDALQYLEGVVQFVPIEVEARSSLSPEERARLTRTRSGN